MSSTINVCDKFKNLFPALSEIEYRMLEKSIIEHGLRDPLIIWNGFIIDGHSRYEICIKRGISFTVKDMSDAFSTEEEVIHWMIKNQLARRNLTSNQRSYFIGKLYNSEKMSHGGSRSKGQNDSLTTRERIADEYKVSSSTVARAGQMAEAMEKISTTGGSELFDKILNKELPITQETIVKLAEITDPEKLIKQVDLLSKGETVYAKSKTKKPSSKPIDIESLPVYEFLCPHCHQLFTAAESMMSQDAS